MQITALSSNREHHPTLRDAGEQKKIGQSCAPPFFASLINNLLTPQGYLTTEGPDLSGVNTLTLSEHLKPLTSLMS